MAINLTDIVLGVVIVVIGAMLRQAQAENVNRQLTKNRKMCGKT